MSFLLPALSFQGTTKVINKGVDITIVADGSTIGTAMKASRILVVRGISTAVLEVTCVTPIDERTISHFVEATGALVFINQKLYEESKHLLKTNTFSEVALKEEELIENVEKIIKLKLASYKNT